jgi:hypothetical protein
MELGARPVERGRFRLDRGLTPPLRDDQRDDPTPRNGTGKQQRMTSTLGSQSIIVLTAHPLQRVGAFALAALVRVSHPHELTEAAFDEAMRQIADHALTAARTRDTKSPEGFWLKCGMSLFPNAPSTTTTSTRRVTPRWRQISAAGSRGQAEASATACCAGGLRLPSSASGMFLWRRVSGTVTPHHADMRG